LTAKITDFGISTQGDTTANMERSLVGTPWYMAPEIINEEAYSNKVIENLFEGNLIFKIG